jgi:hypothetical protein
MGTARSAQPIPPSPVPVTLHIYDVGTLCGIKGINNALRAAGTGAFHCGVEIYGQEYSYGHIDVDETGVFKVLPKQCTAHTYRESVDMPLCTLSREEVSGIIEDLSRQWWGPLYDIIENNCCNFCDVLCQRLGVGSIPKWITSLAGAGAGVAQAGRYVRDRNISFSEKVLGHITGICSVRICERFRRERAESLIIGKRARGKTREEPSKLGDVSRGFYLKWSAGK